jgi:hypothetical protein
MRDTRNVTRKKMRITLRNSWARPIGTQGVKIVMTKEDARSDGPVNPERARHGVGHCSRKKKSFRSS